MKKLVFLLILLAPMIFSFPTVVTLLDDFNRADATPLNGSWTHPLFSGDQDPRLLSNQWAPGPSLSVQYNSYWNTQYGPDCEAYASIPTKPPNDSACYFTLRSVDPGLTTIDGYLFYLVMVTPTDQWQIYRQTNGAVTLLGATVTGPEIASGDSFGASAEGTTLKFWHKPAAGAWTEVMSRTDATYGSAGYVGIGMISITTASGRFDNFSGGTISSAVSNIPAIFSRRRQ